MTFCPFLRAGTYSLTYNHFLTLEYVNIWQASCFFILEYLYTVVTILVTGLPKSKSLFGKLFAKVGSISFVVCFTSYITR